MKIAANYCIAVGFVKELLTQLDRAVQAEGGPGNGKSNLGAAFFTHVALIGTARTRSDSPICSRRRAVQGDSISTAPAASVA